MIKLQKSLLCLMVGMAFSGTMLSMQQQDFELDSERLKVPAPDIGRPVLMAGLSLISTTLAGSLDVQLKESHVSNQDGTVVRAGLAAGLLTQYRATWNEFQHYKLYKKAYAACTGFGIHGAAAYNFSDGVQKWIDQDSRTMLQKDSDGRLPLHYAAAYGKDDSLKTLLQNMRVQLINTQDVKHKRTAVVYAALNGHASTCTLLLQARANGHIADRQGNTVFSVAQFKPEIRQVLQDLYQNEIVIDIPDEEYVLQ